MAGKILLLALAAALAPPPGLAAAPRLMLQKSAVYGMDNQVRALRVPVVDNLGVTKYYDVTIALGLNNTGAIAPTATVTAAQVQEKNQGALRPGIYLQGGDIGTCKVSNVKLGDERTQSYFACQGNVEYNNFRFTVVSGKINYGHPFYAELMDAGLNNPQDPAPQAWGFVTDGYFQMDDCKSHGHIPLAARMEGDNIVVSVFVKGKPGTFLCGKTLTKKTE